MDKKKLLHVLYSGQGGLGTYFMNFVSSDKDGHFEHFAFFYGIELLNRELETFCKEKNIPYAYQQKQAKFDVTGLKKVLKFRKKHQVSFILLHTFSLSLLTLVSLWKRWKVIAIDHTTFSFKTKIERLYTVLNHLFAFKMIYFYKGHFENAKRILPLLKFGKDSHVIPKTVDVNFFKPYVNRPSNKVFTLGITSRLIHGKRHDLILKALSQLRQDQVIVDLKIAGTGPYEKKMKSLTRKLNLANQVKFVGLLNRDELLDFYQALDAYIHASEGETICYSIMEAQACGLPILASDVEGISNYLEDNKSALLFDNNVESIFEIIKNIMKNENVRYDLSRTSLGLVIDNYRNNNCSSILYKMLESYNE